MAARNSTACTVCGTMHSPPKAKTGKFCSIACYRISQRSGQYKRGHNESTHRAPCANCGNVVVGLPSKKRNGDLSENVFCDRNCYDEYRRHIVDSRAKACVGCGSMFVSNNANRKYCSESCWKSLKKATPKNCVNCGCIFTPVKLVKSRGVFISYNSGKTCSASCHNAWIRNDPGRKAKISAAFKGSNHPNWQGGKALLNNVSNRGPNWSKQRSAAIKRDGRRCADCGISEDDCREKYGRGLDVDHVVPFHNFSSYKKANSLSNLRSLCASCHRISEATRGMVQMVLQMQDSKARMHHGYATGERHPKAKLSAYDVVMIRQKSKEGATGASLARMFGVSSANICALLQGKTWQTLK